MTSPRSEAEQRADRRSMVVAAILLAASLASAGSTKIVEAARSRIALSDGHIWVLEGTSHAALLVLVPFVFFTLTRAPLAAGAWKRSIGLHLLAGTLFSLAHVALMWPARLALFPLLVGYPYTFNLGAPSSLAYELTKDIVTYGLMLAGVAANRLIERRGQEAKDLRRADVAGGRLTLGSGGSTVVVSARDVVFAKAADNYVEIHAGGRPHLVRMTLSALEERLREQGPTHIRVHRSYLVALAHIRSIAPTGEGDVEIMLASGEAVPGSRRYRANLSGLEARTGA